MKAGCLAAGFGAALALLWFVGFLHFVQDIKALEADSPETPVDALVVLTGGSERVATGLKLLEAGSGQKLFISGVNKKLTREKVLSGTPLSEAKRACCVILGYEAYSTASNAQEVKDWMASEGFHSLRLVTAHYHMPRSLLLFRAALPEAVILAYPVTPDRLKSETWWRDEGMLELLIGEYNKYLWARIQSAAQGASSAL